MSPMAYEFVASGAADEHTVRWNREAFDRIRLRPRVLRDVATVDTRVTLLGRELPSVRYLDNKGRSKQVRYWEMTVAGGEFAPNDEVDGLEWLGLKAARKRLTYDHDRDVLDAFAEFARPAGEA